MGFLLDLRRVAGAHHVLACLRHILVQESPARQPRSRSGETIEVVDAAIVIRNPRVATATFG
jgi:hypothetical protein